MVFDVQLITSTPENDYACIGVDCVICAEGFMFGTSLSGFNAWRYDGVKIQDAMSELPAPYREMLISGVCPTCWDKLFCDDDEEIV